MKQFLIIFTFIPLVTFGQVNTPTWGVDDTSFCTIKTTDFIMIHSYIELFNYSGMDLPMRWIRKDTAGWPPQWEIGFTDPDSFYVNVLAEDTAEFLLPFPVAFSNQLIINMDHNGHVDTSLIQFNVYPIAYPEDSLLLTFCIIITPPDLAVKETNLTDGVIYYDTQERRIYFTNFDGEEFYISLYDLSGKLILYTQIAGTDWISASMLDSGLYLVQIRGENRQSTTKLWID